MGTPTTSPTLTTEDTTDMARGPLMPSRKPRPIPTICMAMATQLTAMATMERGRLMPSRKPRPIPTTCMVTATQLMDMATTARGPLMLSLRPRLIPTTCTATATQLTDMATTARGPLMPSQKPSPRPSLTCTTATRLIPATAMATERGLLTLSPTMATMATDIQLTAMSTGSNLPEPNFADVPTSYWSIILTYVD